MLKKTLNAYHNRAIAKQEIIDVFSAAGLKQPDISILSDQSLAEVRGPCKVGSQNAEGRSSSTS